MFGKFKQWLGIGGVKVRCVPDSPNLASGGGTLAGHVDLTSKTDQHVSSVIVKVMERRSTGKGAEKKTQDFDLGSVEAGVDVPVKAGQTVTLPFQVSYVIAKSMDDRMRDKGGVLGAMGTLAKMAEHEKTTFEVHAHAKVKGTAFGASNSVAMNLTR